jgi:CheY-like chemotaxis protein
MMKVLLVDPDSRSAQLVSKGLADVGHDVVIASTGSAAMGMLEAERPDLVVSHAQADDMDGFELFTLVRKDPTTMETPFLLIAGRNRPVALAAQEAGANLSVILGDYTPELIVEQVGSILATESVRSDILFDRDGAGRTAEPLWAALDRATAWQQAALSLADGFAGSLDVIDLAEVTQAIALGRKTGRLEVSLAAGAATIVFDNGRVVHAESSGRVGEPAFATIISASQREPDARFRFSRMDHADISSEPRTITRTVEQVLLDIAVGIDEGGEKMAHFEGASPGRRAD